MARRLDEQPTAVELREGLVPAPASSDSQLTADVRRMLEAIERLPEGERNVLLNVLTNRATRKLFGASWEEEAAC